MVFFIQYVRSLQLESGILCEIGDHSSRILGKTRLAVPLAVEAITRRLAVYVKLDPPHRRTCARLLGKIGWTSICESVSNPGHLGPDLALGTKGQ